MMNMTTTITPPNKKATTDNETSKSGHEGDVSKADISTNESEADLGQLKQPTCGAVVTKDPLLDYVASLPTDLSNPTRQVSVPIALDNPTTHGAKTVAEFTELKRRERDGTLRPSEVEYFRYGTETTRRCEERLAKTEGGAMAALFKSAQAALTCTLEALLPLQPVRMEVVAEPSWNCQMTDYFNYAAPPGAFNVIVPPSSDLEAIAASITPQTSMVVLGSSAEGVSPEELSRFIQDCKAKNPSIVFLGDRSSRTPASSLLAHGIDLIVPPPHADAAVLGTGAGAVVGDKARVTRIAEIRGQIGTIASDSECLGHLTKCFNSVATPLTKETEKALAKVDAGEDALVFRSGMAAIHCTLSHLMQRSDGKRAHIIVGSEGYRQTLNILLDRLKPRGEFEISVIPMSDFAHVGKHLKENTVAAFFETPSNPFLNVVPVAQVAEELKMHGSKALLIVDHSFASPVNQTPLTQGADLVVPSLTKYIGGNNTVGGGAVVGSQKLIEPLRQIRDALGSMASDRDCQGVLDGLATLPERVMRANRNGMHVAQILERHKDLVRQVWYPGLPSHPDHAAAREQMKGFGGVVTFRLNAEDLHEIAAFADAFIANATPGTLLAPSFGGDDPLLSVVTVVSHFKQTRQERANRGIPLDLIRLSVGTGNEEALSSALQAGFEALEKARARRRLAA
jgi:cystathionine beta-lyase/cystathionine gamma-synthase